MKQIKYLCLLLLIILFSGCEAKYTLNISPNGLSETLDVTETDITLKDKNIYDDTSYNYTYMDHLNKYISYPLELYFDDKNNGDYGDFYDDSIEHYLTKKIDTNEVFGLKLSSKVNSIDYTKTNLIKSCFKYSSLYTNDSNNNVLITDKSFGCWNEKLDKLSIIINTKYKVINSNADEIDGENYIWNLNSSNYKDKNIFIEYTNYYNDKTVMKNKISSFITSNILLIFSLIVLAIALILIYFIRKIQDKQNEI